ncbi:MAG: GNAT family N-acetyltransferase [Armatimonadetes bacterium]|nr:GNAT family N-acetyltransferase [Armatimonadota bacterium]
MCEGLPEVAVPAGYLIRTYRHGDSAAWCRLINGGIGGEWTEAGLQEEMDGAKDFQAADLFFAVEGEEVVGTTWALRRESFPLGVGSVHMLAVEPEHRRRGLGRLLVLFALRRFCEQGIAGARLQTDDVRLPAIKIYLGVGFRPLLTHESHLERWRKVYRKLGLNPEEVQR